MKRSLCQLAGILAIIGSSPLLVMVAQGEDVQWKPSSRLEEHPSGSQNPFRAKRKHEQIRAQVKRSSTLNSVPKPKARKNSPTKRNEKPQRTQGMKLKRQGGRQPFRAEVASKRARPASTSKEPKRFSPPVRTTKLTANIRPARAAQAATRASNKVVRKTSSTKRRNRRTSPRGDTRFGADRFDPFESTVRYDKRTTPRKKARTGKRELVGMNLDGRVEFLSTVAGGLGLANGRGQVEQAGYDYSYGGYSPDCGCESCDCDYGCGDTCCGCGDACSGGCQPDPCRSMLDSCWHSLRIIPRPSNFTAFGGVHAFKGPLDRNRDSGNFGIHEGFNLGGRLGLWRNSSVAYQVGYQLVHSQLHGSEQSGTSDPHTQQFITAGLFRRPCGVGLQYGAVWDILRDERDRSLDFHQIRAEVGLINHCGREIGFHTAIRANDTGTANVPLRATDQFLGYYRIRAKNGGEARFLAGFNDNDKGIVGADMMVPLTCSCSMSGVFRYMIPEENRGGSGAQQEAWNLSFNLVWHWGRSANRCSKDPYRPLFDVADNGSLIVDRRP